MIQPFTTDSINLLAKTTLCWSVGLTGWVHAWWLAPETISVLWPSLFVCSTPEACQGSTSPFKKKTLVAL